MAGIEDYAGDFEGGFETIQIQVSGARNLLPEGFTGLAARGQTWTEFLMSCRVEIKARVDQMFVRTWQTDKVKLPSGVGHWGWTAEMNERIATFIAKYPVEKKRKSYSVMLCWKPEAAPAAKRRSGQRKPINQEGLTAGGPPQLPRQPSIVISMESSSVPVLDPVRQVPMGPPPPPGRRSIFKRPLPPRPAMPSADKRVYPFSLGVGGAMSSAFYQRRSAGALDPLGLGTGSRPNYGQRIKEDDTMSLCTSVGAEETELVKEGIAPENLKPEVKAGLLRFSETFLGQVRDEIERLQRNNLWDRNFGRAPLSSWFLQEIFKQ